MQQQMDQFDIEAEKEAMALCRFRDEIGRSNGQTGTPKARTKKRPCKGSNQHHFEGAKAGVWRGLTPN